MRLQKNLSSRVLFFCLSLFLISTAGTGCASTQKTTSTQTTVSTANTDDLTEQPVAVEKTQTETTTKSESPRSPGLLGGLFGAIGSILAFPFKVVGAIIEAIF